MSSFLAEEALRAFADTAEEVGWLTHEQVENIYAAMAADGALSSTLRCIAKEMGNDLTDNLTDKEWERLGYVIMHLPGMDRSAESDFIAEPEGSIDGQINMKFMSGHGKTDDNANGAAFIDNLLARGFWVDYDKDNPRCMTVQISTLRTLLTEYAL